MTQTEFICETCNSHYYVVTEEILDNEPDFCPFCQSSVTGSFGDVTDDVEE